MISPRERQLPSVLNDQLSGKGLRRHQELMQVFDYLFGEVRTSQPQVEPEAKVEAEIKSLRQIIEEFLPEVMPEHYESLTVLEQNNFRGLFGGELLAAKAEIKPELVDKIVIDYLDFHKIFTAIKSKLSNYQENEAAVYDLVLAHKTDEAHIQLVLRYMADIFIKLKFIPIQFLLNSYTRKSPESGLHTATAV
jgi:hypothetical protein